MYVHFIRNFYLNEHSDESSLEVFKMKPIEIAMIGINGALYAIVGYLSNLGVIAPVVGVVRFWPAVVVPAVFAVLFGPLAGGIGAGIGIFISDMLIHGNPLLSLTVGVPSNFFGFYLVGYFSRKKWNWLTITLGVAFSSLFVASTVYLMTGFLTTETSLLFLGACLVSYALILIVAYILPEFRSYGAASVIGLGFGSTWIGFGLWAYSQVLELPLSLGWERFAPFYASFLWLTWTFSTEIPFLVTIVPPILKACYRAFPSLMPPNK